LKKAKPAMRAVTTTYPAPESVRELLAALDAQRLAEAAEHDTSDGIRRTVAAVSRTAEAFALCGWWWRELPMRS